MKNILIADDHEVTRRGIRELLKEAFLEVNIFETPNIQVTLENIKAQPWDLLILDLFMPDGNTIEAVPKIRDAGIIAPILIVTASQEISYVAQVMKAGANGLMHKHRAVECLTEALKVVAEGGTYLHPETATEIATHYYKGTTELPHEKLSARELEVFRLIAKGRSVKEIATDLSISEKTVATHLARAREKTGLKSPVEIARYALIHGLVE